MKFVSALFGLRVTHTWLMVYVADNSKIRPNSVTDGWNNPPKRCGGRPCSAVPIHYCTRGLQFTFHYESGHSLGVGPSPWRDGTYPWCQKDNALPTTPRQQATHSSRSNGTTWPGALVPQHIATRQEPRRRHDISNRMNKIVHYLFILLLTGSRQQRARMAKAVSQSKSYNGH